MSLNEMIGRLSRIRQNIEDEQNKKLAKRWDKYGDYRDWKLSGIFDHLLLEIQELEKALLNEGPNEIKDEILDVRNCTEFLWDFLYIKRV